jgi:DUF4097 and DUF4098 domain-containing protein YvlB
MKEVKMSLRRLNSSIILAVVTAALGFLQTLPASASAEGSFERTLQVNGAVSLDITTGSGNVEVRTGSSSQVLVTGRIRVSDWFGENGDEKVRKIEANPPIQQSGNDIRIGHLDDPELRHNVSISYEVVVPPDTQLHSHTGSGNQTVAGIHGSLEVESGSGTLKVSDVGSTVRAEAGSGNITIDHVTGNVRAKSGSGTISATNIAGGIEAEAGSGNLRLEQTSSGAVRAQTGSGGIDLSGLQGSLEATAGSGNIKVEGAPTGMWSVHTGSGGVRLRMASNPGFDLSARTGSGSISVAPAIEVQGSIGRKEIHGKVRGGGVPVQVETGSGSIDIE